jgi:hypothetical protein
MLKEISAALGIIDGKDGVNAGVNAGSAVVTPLAPALVVELFSSKPTLELALLIIIPEFSPWLVAVLVAGAAVDTVTVAGDEAPESALDCTCMYSELQVLCCMAFSSANYDSCT